MLSIYIIVEKYVPNEMDLAFEFDLATAMLRSAQQGRNRAVVNAILDRTNLLAADKDVVSLTGTVGAVASTMTSVAKANPNETLLLM